MDSNKLEWKYEHNGQPHWENGVLRKQHFITNKETMFVGNNFWGNKITVRQSKNMFVAHFGQNYTDTIEEAAFNAMKSK